MSEMNDRLLDAAEAAIRLRGYHAVSFRELADELGIKSASVHYYYRQKEDLGLAVVARYQERFFKLLEQRSKSLTRFDKTLSAFISVYRDSLVSSDRICLCGMLGSESSGLPPELAAAVASFFSGNVMWLSGRMPSEWTARACQTKAIAIVAGLQGAMMLSTSLKDHGHFDATSADLLTRYKVTARTP